MNRMQAKMCFICCLLRNILTFQLRSENGLFIHENVDANKTAVLHSKNSIQNPDFSYRDFLNFEQVEPNLVFDRNADKENEQFYITYLIKISYIHIKQISISINNNYTIIFILIISFLIFDLSKTLFPF